MKKKLRATLMLIVGYLAVSSLCHYVLFPEPGPDFSDLPRRGTTVGNGEINSKFVYRETSIESAGQRFEWDNFVEPGGGPIDIPHVHPHMREIFHVIDGEMQFRVNGEDRLVKAGEEIVAQPGAAHAFHNASGKPVYMVSRFEPAEDGPWEDLARRGLLVDSEFVQFERAGGLGRLSALQMMVFGSRFKQGYAPGIPTWMQDAAAFLVAPTARLFGVHSYYPPGNFRDSRPTS